MTCCQPGSQNSFVSLSVRAGHFYDPMDCQGLAHLLEHMMFMGSRHLPKPNAVNELLERSGGSINAWTGTEYANYHFQCDSEALTTVLPAFSDMLNKPLIQESSITNEIQAIDAEFQFKRKDDLRRLYQVHKETCNPEHPFSQFSVGNKDVYGRHSVSALQARLRQFHEKYYCGNNMCLCIISPHPDDMMQEVVTQCFGALSTGEMANTQWPALYQKDQLGIQINIRPLQNARRMIVTFALPGIHNDFRTKPLNYISHLLGDEGEGSLLAYLKDKHWVTNLIAGSGIEGDDFKDFNVSFQLTQEGLSHQQDILLALFYTLDLIRSSVKETWRYQEKAQLSALAVQYEENPKPMNVACDYAEHLFMYSFEEIPLLRATIDNFDEAIILDALASFSVDNLRVKLIAPDVNTDRVSEYYAAHYAVEALPAALLGALKDGKPFPDISLPPPNPYLGEEYHLAIPEDGFEVPQCLNKRDGFSFWFAQDQQFYSPKGDIYLSFDSPGFTASIEAVAAKRIWLGALNDYLQSKYYRAEIAGLHYRIYGHQAGFTLHTRGFTNQQVLLAEQLTDACMAFTPDEECVEKVRAVQIQGLENSLLNKPTNRLFSRLSVLIQRNTHAPVELLNAIKRVTTQGIIHARNDAFSSYYVETLMHGNWSSDEAARFSGRLLKHCPSRAGGPLSRAISRLPTGQTLYHHVACEHDDAAVVLYLQAPQDSLEDTAMCMLLEQMIAAPFFNTLRTEMQLGYVVGTGYTPHNQHPGIAFYIQSPTHDPASLISAITQFLFQQLNELDFYRYYWPSIQNNLLKQLEERDLSLSMKSQRFWVSLGTRDIQFNRNTSLAECISELTFEHIEDYARKLANREHFGELVLYANGRFPDIGDQGENTVSSIASFKNSTGTFDKN